jgi:hypothetical protein
MELEKTTQQQRLMNWCKNDARNDAKTNTATGAISANISLSERDIAHIAPSNTGKGPKTAPAEPKDLLTRPNWYWPFVAVSRRKAPSGSLTRRAARGH